MVGGEWARVFWILNTMREEKKIKKEAVDGRVWDWNKGGTAEVVKAYIAVERRPGTHRGR